MTRAQVDEYLAIYRECVGRVGSLELTIQRQREELERRKRNLAADAALESPVHEEGMPHGSGVGNPVERIVLKYADGFLPPEIIEDEKQLKALEEELKYRKEVVLYVDAWLKGLNEREAWIINHKVIDMDYSWREVIVMYRLQYGEEYSRDALKRIKERAMEKIYHFAE